jgi:hypothetical protein
LYLSGGRDAPGTTREEAEMADEQSNPDATPNQPGNEQPKAPETPATPAGSGEDTAGLKSALVKEREARKLAEKAAADLAAWKQEQEDKGKSETERLAAEAERATKERDAATAQIAAANERVIRAEVRAQALALGFADVDDAWALIDRAAVSLDDSGDVKGAKEAVKALATKKPHLIRADTGGGYGAPAGSRANSAPPDARQQTRANLQRLMSGRRAS